MPEAIAPLPPKLEFLDSHQPGLKSGVYQLTVTQKVAIGGTVADTSARTQQFGVFGERFALDEDDVVAVFPPPGSLGDHADVLPHVVLRRSTLPWERLVAPVGDEGEQAQETIPWMAVLVFDEDDLAAGVAQPPNVRLETLKAAGAGWPGVKLQPAQHDDDLVSVIDVPNALLAAMIPTGAELRYLAHVRRGLNERDVVEGDEYAVVVAGRLPKSGGASVAHLVSLEGRYVYDPPTAGYRFAGLGQAGTVRLVSLKSWRFSCLDANQSFAATLRRLDRAPAELRLPPVSPAGSTEKYLSRGYVPCPHYLRRGATSVSWYHGPLVPAAAAEPVPPGLYPARAADALLRYDQDTGLLDTGYAAAWELGRLLALGSGRVAASLSRWRHELVRYAHADTHLAEPHLPTTSRVTERPALPAVALRWLESVAILCGVPFNYLVPDERMLPADSMRLFGVDPAWMAALLDGALSVGRVTSAHHAADVVPIPQVQALLSRRVTGVLVRSSVVAGWPKMVVEGFKRTPATPHVTAQNVKLPLLRMERLSRDVLLCLFEGEVTSVEMHQPPEAVHFAVRLDTDPPSLDLRLGNGRAAGRTLSVPMRPGNRRVIDVGKLVGLFTDTLQAQLGLVKAFNSAKFALQMLEIESLVCFGPAAPTSPSHPPSPLGPLQPDYPGPLVADM